MKPWEKYQKVESAPEESGPWSKYAKAPEAKKASPIPIPLELLASHSPMEQSEPVAPWKKTLSHYARPTLEAGGMAGGSLIGGGMGLPTGPGAALTAAAGGTLGYGIGKQSADYLDQLLGLRKPPNLRELAVGTGKDLVTGAAYEAGGQIFGKAVLAPTFKAGKWVFNKSKDFAKALFSKKAMEQTAGKVLMAHTSDGIIYAENAKQAKAIEKEIPGLKFTMGQQTADPALIKLERTQMRKPGPAAAENAERIAANNEALKSYYQKNFPGKEGIDDLSGTLQKTRSDLQTLETGTRDAALNKATDIGPTKPQETGSNLLQTIEKAKGPVKSAMGELESQIPDYQMGFDNTKKSIDGILSSKKISVGQRKTVERVQKDIEKVLEQGESTHTAFGVRRTINDEIDKAFSTGNDSTGAVLMGVKEGLEADLAEITKLARTGKIAEYEGKVIYPDKLAAQYEENAKRIATSRATREPDVAAMTKGIKEATGSSYMRVTHEPAGAFENRVSKDYTRITGQEVPYKTVSKDTDFINKLAEKNAQIKQILAGVEPGKDVASAMKAYNDFASKEYFGRFGKGSVKQATARGTQAGGTAARPETLSGYFTSPSGSDDLIRAIGQEEAGALMRGHYAYDLLKSTTGEDGYIITSKLSSWMKSNAEQLEKYGIKVEFDSVFKSQAIVEDAAKVATEFERGAAARILKADPEKAISNAIKGSTTGKAAADLLRTIKGDTAATEGLKNAFADHIMTQIQTTAKDVAGNPIISNAAFQRTMAKYAPAMRVLYKNDPAKLKALETMKQAYEIAIRNTRSPLGGGSDTAENVLTALSSINLLSRTASIARGVWRTIRKYSLQQVDDLVTRAMFDPDYAETLVNTVNGTIKESELQTILNGKIIKLDDFRQRRMAAAVAGTIAGARAIGGDDVGE